MVSKVHVARIAIFHLSALTVFWVGWSWTALAVFFVSFALRSFGISAGYHRYFSHRAFKTSRGFQFLLGLLGASSGQKGPLSWITSHRIHHRTSDHAGDPHSPTEGFFHAYIGWLLPTTALPTDLQLTQDFAQYPEIRWLNKYHNIGPLACIAVCAALGTYLAHAHPTLGTGPGQLVVWGFILSGLTCLHGTLMVNTIGHSSQERDSRTGDFSRNVGWLLPITLGECWHHNHHQSQKSAKFGRTHLQIDFIYIGICLLEKLRLISGVHRPAISTAADLKKQSPPATPRASPPDLLGPF